MTNPKQLIITAVQDGNVGELQRLIPLVDLNTHNTHGLSPRKI